MNSHRRLFLKIGIQATAASLLPVSAMASIGRLLKPERTLSFYNTHTGESLDVCYYARGRYQFKAFKQINYILRDHRTGKVNPIHIRLMDVLYSVSATLDSQPRFHIISGYRSPETNAMLCKNTKGVAKNSLHVQGKAIDIRIPGYNTKFLRDICMKMQAGGVGYYPKSDFVHVDIGKTRFW